MVDREFEKLSREIHSLLQSAILARPAVQARVRGAKGMQLFQPDLDGWDPTKDGWAKPPDRVQRLAWISRMHGFSDIKFDLANPGDEDDRSITVVYPLFFAESPWRVQICRHYRRVFPNLDAAVSAIDDLYDVEDVQEFDERWQIEVGCSCLEYIDLADRSYQAGAPGLGKRA